MWLLKFESQSACVPVGAAGCPAQSPPTVDFSLVSHRSLLLMARRRSDGSPLQDTGGGDYLSGVCNPADREKDECVCFVCTDIIQKIIDRHLEAMGHNQELLVHLIWQISPKRNKKLTCGWEEYDFLIITEQLRDVANNQNQCFCMYKVSSFMYHWLSFCAMNVTLYRFNRNFL